MKGITILLIAVQALSSLVQADYYNDYQESIEFICQNHKLRYSDVLFFHNKCKFYNTPVRLDVSQKHQGLGVFAARNIKQGELLMRETPLLMFENESFNKSEPEFSIILDRVLEGLSDNDYNEFLTLANAFESGEESPLTGIIYSNVFDLQNKTGLFLKISRINHSCKPSVQTDFDGEYMHLHAMRDIQAGEELHITYVDTFLSKEERQNHLYEGYGFICDCELCSANRTQEEQRESDANRDKIKIVNSYEEIMGKSPVERLKILESAMDAAHKERLEDDPLTMGSIYFYLFASLSELPHIQLSYKHNSTLLAKYAFGNMSAVYGQEQTREMFKSHLPRRVYLNLESTLFNQ